MEYYSNLVAHLKYDKITKKDHYQGPFSFVREIPSPSTVHFLAQINRIKGTSESLKCRQSDVKD